MKEQWIDELREGMKDFKAEVPEGLLDDIKKEMKQRGLVPPPMVVEKRNISKIFVYTTMAAAAILLLLFMLQSKVQDTTVVYLTKSKTPSTIIRKDRVEPLLAIDETPKMTEQHQVSGKNIAKRTNDITPKSDSEIEENTAVATENKEKTTVKNTEKKKYDNKAQKKYYTYRTSDPTNIERKRKVSSISIGAVINGSYGATNGSQGIMLAMADPIGTYNFALAGDNSKSFIKETGALQKNLNHHQPIKIGLSIRYPLSNKWSLIAGITYSNLASDLTYSNDASGYTTSQTLHYVGVPVAASYSLLQKKSFNLYVMAGFEVEKLVYGKSIDEYSNTTEKIIVKESRPQFSVNAAIGVEYKLANGISAFAEPGFSYYMENGSNIQSIYKDRPANLNLNFGLRINVNK